MEPISISSGIAGLITLAMHATDTLIRYVSAVKAGPRNIAELKDELDSMSEVLSELLDFLSSDRAKGRAFREKSFLFTAISAYKTRMERIGDRIRGANGGRVSRWVNQLNWPFERREVSVLVENLRSFMHIFQFSLSVKSLDIMAENAENVSADLAILLEQSKKDSEQLIEMSKRVSGLVDLADDAKKRSWQIDEIIKSVPLLEGTAREVLEISHGVREAEIRDQELRTTEILNWLCPISMLSRHAEVQAKRAKGTGTWFTKRKEFQSWAKGRPASSSLLANGGPGVGKTILTSIVIDHLREECSKDDLALAYFYCDHGQQQTQTAQIFAGSILRQFVQRSASTLPSCVTEFYQQNKDGIRDQAWFRDLLTVIIRVASTFEKCFIIIDALDETDPRDFRPGLFDILDYIQTNSTSTVRLFATTRPHIQGIQDQFLAAVKIDVCADDFDLRLYLSQMISMSRDSDDIIDAELKKQILDKLCSNAKGMFLLPVLQIRTVLEQVTKSDIRKSLSNLSENLNDVFAATLARIAALPPSKARVGQKSLLWISYAKRPLTTAELRHALAVRPEENELDRDNLVSIRTMLESCCGLVELDQHSSTVHFVHFSLEEYLKSQPDYLDGEVEITKTCLRYMTMESLKGLPFKKQAEFSKVIDELALLNYACAEWGEHAKKAEYSRIKTAAMFFLKSRLHLLTAARCRERKYGNYSKWEDRLLDWSSTEGAGISTAAGFGLTSVVHDLISQSFSPVLTARNFHSSTPLHETARKGYVDTAELLIKHGANLLDQNAKKSTPLFMAVAYNQIDMVKMLLNHDSEQLIVAGWQGWMPLHKAVDSGNRDIVSILVQAGAFIDAQDDKRMTALHLAAKKGNFEIVRMLLAAGATVHIKGSDQLAPLDLAANQGHVEIVRLLLDAGGKLDHIAKDKWTPIHRAARGGHLKTVQLLIEKGADVLIEDNNGALPIHLGTRSGSLAVVSHLLNCRPHIRTTQLFAKDKNGSTPRETAFFTAHYPIHKYLRMLETQINGPSPNPENDRVTYAIEEGQLSKVKKLIQKKANIDEPDSDHQPPLHVAIQENQLRIAEMLIEYGADIESIGHHGWRPLHVAASLGNLQMVKLCMKHGAVVDSASNTSQTPIHKACSGKNVEVVRHLLEAGADPEAANDRGMRALHIAAQHNAMDIARCLVIEWGADLLAMDKTGDWPSAWADRAGHLEMAAFLNEEAKKQKKAIGMKDTLAIGKGKKQTGRFSPRP